MNRDASLAEPSLVSWTERVGHGVQVATFVGLDAQARFLVRTTAEEAPTPAASTIALGAPDAGIQVVIALQGGDARRPFILGRLLERALSDASESVTVRSDGEKLVLRADREIELRCGEASIVLTRAGKVLIKGAYVLTRSSGANRIKGAYVDIN